MTEQQVQQAFQRGQFARLQAFAKQQQDHWRRFSPVILEQLGLACSLAGDHVRALDLLRLLAAQYPFLSSVQAHLGVALLRAGDYPAALARLAAIAERGAADAEGWFNLGLCHWQLGSIADADAALLHCLRLEPAHLEAAIYLASCAISRGDMLLAWSRARAITPAQALASEALERWAAVLMALDRATESEAAYRQLLARYPGDAAALVNLAALCERAHRLDEAETLLASLPEADRQHPHAQLIAVRLRRARGDDTGALAAAEEALRECSASARGRAALRLDSELHFEHAAVLDRLQRYEQAHGAALLANAQSRAVLAQALGEGARVVAQNDWPSEESAADAVVARSRNVATEPERVAPIFLVGFPRSGTTLLDRILGSHPQFAVLEERPAADALWRHLAREDTKGVRFDDYLEGARAAYWQVVDDHLTLTPRRRLVDKNPLNFVQVHALMAAFPSSSWIFAVRHPCDVVLSCFLQNFRFSNVHSGFWTLTESARLYVRLMTQWLERRERLQPRCFELRYEALVSEPEPVLRALFAFLEAEWRPEVLRFHEQVKGHHIATPSYRQVAQPIHAGAVQRWRHYEPWFAEAKPLLEPLVRRLGYPSLLETTA